MTVAWPGRYTCGVIETEGLTHLHLRVSDLNRSLAFYQQVFGMVERFRDGDLVFLNTPGSDDTITLNPNHDGRAGTSGGIEHFGFRLKDGASIDDAVATVIGAGGALVRGGEHAPGEPYAYVTDPDGYVIEL